MSTGLARHEVVVARGLNAFLEVGAALITAEQEMAPEDFDTFCRVHVGAQADTVRPLLDIVRALS